jgi:hypothetical protein
MSDLPRKPPPLSVSKMSSSLGCTAAALSAGHFPPLNYSIADFASKGSDIGVQAPVAHIHHYPRHRFLCALPVLTAKNSYFTIIFNLNSNVT